LSDQAHRRDEQSAQHEGDRGDFRKPRDRIEGGGFLVVGFMQKGDLWR
jgi:hypothetical protein